MSDSPYSLRALGRDPQPTRLPGRRPAPAGPRHRSLRPAMHHLAGHGRRGPPGDGSPGGTVGIQAHPHDRLFHRRPPWRWTSPSTALEDNESSGAREPGADLAGHPRPPRKRPWPASRTSCRHYRAGRTWPTCPSWTNSTRTSTTPSPPMPAPRSMPSRATWTGASPRWSEIRPLRELPADTRPQVHGRLRRSPPRRRRQPASRFPPTATSWCCSTSTAMRPSSPPC